MAKRIIAGCALAAAAASGLGYLLYKRRSVFGCLTKDVNNSRTSDENGWSGAQSPNCSQGDAEHEVQVEEQEAAAAARASAIKRVANLLKTMADEMDVIALEAASAAMNSDEAAKAAHSVVEALSAVLNAADATNMAACATQIVVEEVGPVAKMRAERPSETSVSHHVTDMVPQPRKTRLTLRALAILDSL